MDNTKFAMVTHASSVFSSDNKKFPLQKRYPPLASHVRLDVVILYCQSSTLPSAQFNFSDMENKGKGNSKHGLMHGSCLQHRENCKVINIKGCTRLWQNVGRHLRFLWFSVQFNCKSQERREWCCSFKGFTEKWAQISLRLPHNIQYTHTPLLYPFLNLRTK